jgi:hypothetical protein
MADEKLGRGKSWESSTFIHRAHGGGTWPARAKKGDDARMARGSLTRRRDDMWGWHVSETRKSTYDGSGWPVGPQRSDMLL